MSITEPIKVSCTALWDIMNYGLMGLKTPDALSPDQFLAVIRKMLEALMLYYVRCGP